MKDLHGAKCGEVVWIFHALPEHASVPESLCSPTWKLSENPIILDFYGGFIT